MVAHDKTITVFSNEGRLHQIEYCIKAAANNSANSVLGACVRGSDSVAMCCQKKVPDKLLDPNYVTNMYLVTPKIGMMCIGSKPDSMSLVDEARRMAFSFLDKNGYQIPVHVLANKIGKFNQVRTQNAGMRALAVTAHFSGCDLIPTTDGSGSKQEAQLYRVDPSGSCLGWKSCATGPKEQEAQNFLEKMLKKNNNGRGKESTTIRCAIDCLQKVLESDMKPKDLEVCVVNAQGYRILGAEEVDEHLTYIHENEGEL